MTPEEIIKQLEMAEAWFDVTPGQDSGMGPTIPVVREHGLNLFRGALGLIKSARTEALEEAARVASPDIEGLVERLLCASDQQAYRDNAVVSTLFEEAADALTAQQRKIDYLEGRIAFWERRVTDAENTAIKASNDLAAAQAEIERLRSEALEEAAKVADEICLGWTESQHCGAAIRALKGQQE